MAKKENTNQIKDWEKQFVDVYFNNGFNARQAYKTVKPNVKIESADVLSHQLLKEDRVKEYIEQKQIQIQMQQEVKLEWLVKELKEIVYEIKQQDPYELVDDKILVKKDYKALIAALDQLGKIGGHQTKKIDVTSGGEQILTDIKINIIRPKEDESGD
jgi:hypothetical protein